MLPSGAIDSHVHCAPDAIPRAEHCWDLVRSAGDAGMRALVLKDHCTSTAGLCDLLNRLQDRVTCLGSLTLNAPVGGWNPLAVDAALAAGARVIWAPTYCAAHHLRILGPRRAPAGLPHPDDGFPGYALHDASGGIRPEIIRICRSIAAADAVLATGHLAPAETLALIQEARTQGVRRLVVTHASETVPGLSVEDQRRAAALGAWIEHSFLPLTPCGGASLDARSLLAQIRAVGLDRILLSSDFGQVANGPVVAGFAVQIEAMRLAGLDRDEVEALVVDHPTRLLFGDPR